MPALYRLDQLSSADRQRAATRAPTGLGQECVGSAPNPAAR